MNVAADRPAAAAPARRRVWGHAVLASLPAQALLVWQVVWLWPFVSDDAFISLRYTQRLLAGDGLTWTDGERVEGYSNLLWVLGCAGLGALGVDLVTAARALGIAATAVALVVLARAAAPHDRRSALQAAGAPLLVASAQATLGWTAAGLEGPLLLLWLALGFTALVRLHGHGAAPAWPLRGLLTASVPFALACWTRPDAPLWVAATAGALLLAGPAAAARARLLRVVAFVALPVLAVAAQLVFRIWYHGDVVPNTAHVKAELELRAVGAGVHYVAAALIAHAGLAAAAAVGTLRALAAGGRLRTCALVLGVPVLVWCVYLVAIGGDHFPARRLFHGALVPLALLAWLAAAPPAPRATWRRPLGTLLLLAAAIVNLVLARTDAQSHELRGELWEWRGREIGRALRAAFGPAEPLLAVDAAGAVPFYSELPALDLLGLCDRTIATTPVPAWLDTALPGTPRPPGHLHGNGDYVMDRAPDLLLFSRPPHLPLPVFVSAAEFEDDERFRDGYRCVLLELPDRPIARGLVETLVVPLWVRLDGAAGVQRHGGHVVIPGLLFGSMRLERPLLRRYQPPPDDAAVRAADAAHVAEWMQWFGARRVVVRPDPDTGAFGLLLTSGSATLRCTLPPGAWRPRVEPAGAAVTVHADGVPASADGSFVVGDERPVTLRLQHAGPPGDGAAPVRIDRVFLERD